MIDLVEVLDILEDNGVDNDPETDKDNFFEEMGNKWQYNQIKVYEWLGY